MTAREDIAEAASTVDGVSCSAYFRATTKAGDAVVRLDRTSYPDKFGGLDTWQVVVILPSDYAAAEKYAERITDPVVDALQPFVTVTSVAPSQIVLDSGPALPVLLVEATRERD